MSKIGVVITTFNSQDYFNDLFFSLPLTKIDHLVVVNGGKEYENPDRYKCHWIQHDSVKFASVARNDGLKYLQEKECDYYFVIEDDMIILNENIFDKYIEASKMTGIEYLCYASNAWESGSPHKRTPVLTIQYENNVSLNLYKNTCNEFTFRTKNLLKTCGLYDERFQFTFDIDSLYNMHIHEFIKFWYFPDISDSDNYINNNPNAQSRMNSKGERDKIISHNFELFHQKYKLNIPSIPKVPYEDLMVFLKTKKANK